MRSQRIVGPTPADNPRSGPFSAGPGSPTLGARAPRRDPSGPGPRTDATMTTRSDRPDAPPPDRRWRFDGQPGPDPDDRSPGAVPPAPGASGRRAVGTIVAAVLTLWLGLDLAFRGWKARYRARADFGATRVAPAVDPLADLVPPGISPDDWRAAVADTRAMLVALTGSGVLDESRMEDLRRDLAARVAGARPETALRALAALWDDLELKAGPVIAPDRAPPPAGSRHAARHRRPARPRILGPSPAPPAAKPEGVTGRDRPGPGSWPAPPAPPPAIARPWPDWRALAHGRPPGPSLPAAGTVSGRHSRRSRRWRRS